MSNGDAEAVARSAVKEVLRNSGLGVGKQLDKMVPVAGLLVEGINRNYNLDVPLYEVIVPAALLVFMLAHSVANWCKS